jgi:hypothetical protein
VYERPDFLDALPDGLEWVAALREQHRAAALAYGEAFAALVELRSEQQRSSQDYGQRVRDAIRAGKSAPAMPPEATPEVQAAQIELATEALERARDEVALHAIDAFYFLRSGRAELPAGLPPALLEIVQVRPVVLLLCDRVPGTPASEALDDGGCLPRLIAGLGINYRLRERDAVGELRERIHSAKHGETVAMLPWEAAQTDATGYGYLAPLGTTAAQLEAATAQARGERREREQAVAAEYLHR